MAVNAMWSAFSVACLSQCYILAAFHQALL